MSSSSGLPAPLALSATGAWLGDSGSWSTFYVHVGTPPQYFHVLPSFNGQTALLPIDEDCLRYNITDCGAQRGVEVFQSQQSLGFQKNASSTWKELGIYRLGLGADLGLTGNGLFGYDTFGAVLSGSSISIENLAIAAYATPDFWVGQLGLSPFPINMSTTEPHSLLSRLKEEQHIPSLSFGYQAGAPYRFTKVPGSLILGGYDRSRQGNETLLVSSTQDIMVGVQSVKAKFANGTSTDFLSTGIIATIDTNADEIWLPQPICDTIAAALNLTWFEPAKRYVLTDAAHVDLQKSNPTISFAIGTAASGGETINISIPYAAFDLQVGYPILGATTNYFPLRRASDPSQYTLGRVFMQEVYLSIDWERNVFNISQAAWNSPPLNPDIVTIEPKNKTANLIPRPPPPASSQTKLSTGAVAGVAIGAVLIILLLAVGWWFRRRKQVKARTQVDQETPQHVPTDEKKDTEHFAPDAPTKGSPTVEERTELELEGREVPELYAPHGESEMHYFARKPKTTQAQVTEMVEADSVAPTPIYELPERKSGEEGKK